MAPILRLAVVDPIETTRRELTQKLIGVGAFWLEGECSQYEAFPQVVAEQKPDVALVCLDASPDRAIRLIETLHSQDPDCAICAISTSNDGERILRAMRAGAEDFLTLPVDAAEMVSALKKIAKHSDAGRNGRREGLTIAVAGTSGGVGSTSLAVNLGAILAREPAKPAVLIDLDLALGDADVYLDVNADAYTLVDLAENYSRLDSDLLQRSLAKSKSGLCVLPRPGRLAAAGVVTEETLRGLLSLLEVSFSRIVIDVSKAYNALDMAALQAADLILLVTQLNLPNLRNVIRLLRMLQEQDGLADKVKIVVNRLSLQETPIRRKKAEEIIGRQIYWELPNEYALVAEGCNNGVPLIERAPRAAITRSLVQLAESLEPRADGAADMNRLPAVSRRRWFSLWPTGASK